MIERIRRPQVAPQDQDDVYRAQLAEQWRRVDPAGVAALEASAAALQARQVGYPQGYRACGICKTPLGQKCRSLSGRIIDGRPDGVATELDHPHKARKRRTRRVR